MLLRVLLDPRPRGRTGWRRRIVAGHAGVDFPNRSARSSQGTVRQTDTRRSACGPPESVRCLRPHISRTHGRHRRCSPGDRRRAVWWTTKGVRLPHAGIRSVCEQGRSALATRAV